jgi:Holliday junction resolvasome RuvABC endonuclease subunit
MPTLSTRHELVLAVQLCYRGFAFVLFEGPEAPFDWGLKEIRPRREKNIRTLIEVKRLIDRFRPEVLVIEETAGQQPPRGARIRRLSRMLAQLAVAEYVELHRCSRAEVKACFASVGATTKHEIAKAIATQIPAFAHRIPRLRRQWSSEDARQAIFDAVALAITYFARGIPSPYTDDLAA